MRGAVGGLLLAALLTIGGTTVAQNEAKKPAIKGKIQGGDALENPVWSEAKDPKNRRYTFRTLSPTVSKQAKRLTAYLPKELCIAVLKKEGTVAARGTPVAIGVSGGRTSPVTLVVAEGQNVQFVNYDPFPHKLFDAGRVQNGLGPEEMKPGGSRIWKPPAVGVYEIRDQLFPSIRSWIVVEPRVAAVGHPSIAGDYLIRDLEPGAYELVGYFNGKPTGKPLAIEVKPAPDEQEIREPLVVGEKKSGEDEDK